MDARTKIELYKIAKANFKQYYMKKIASVMLVDEIRKMLKTGPKL